MYMMRFDMRAPVGGAPPADLYAAALDMAAWAETRGCISAVVCEHHASDDGYLPSPIVLASAMAARTSTLMISVAIVILPLHDPIQLAEEMAVLDLISRGRVMFVLAIGYRPEEYEMYGVEFTRRGKIAEEKLSLLMRARSGEPFEHEGRRIHVTPAPFTPGGPMLAWGGGSIPAAQRAGRHGISFFGQSNGEGMKEAYEQAAREHGHQPGMCLLPSADEALTQFVSDDLDGAWEELGPYLMHDVRSYASWNEGNTGTASLSFATSAEELRAENRSHQVITVDQAVEQIRAGRPLALHPLIGGLPPDIAWKYLRTVTDVVLPKAAGA